MASASLALVGVGPLGPGMTSRTGGLRYGGGRITLVLPGSGPGHPGRHGQAGPVSFGLGLPESSLTHADAKSLHSHAHKLINNVPTNMAGTPNGGVAPEHPVTEAALAAPSL